ncbi:hypothetical protein [Mycobacteroides abscessus]|uniref:hypothetical protein n=1 Tax=Mycobacteroides abscessus TaxID=36809 RepID=UPI0009411C41|nr:hypothetical protein [Mycobacteroides abscessus]
MTDGFLGHGITGNIAYYGRRQSEQHDPAELVAALDALFAFPEVVSVRWTQYTPYFNDGDACTFSVHEARTKLVDTDEDAGDYEDGFISSSGDWPSDYFETHSYGEWFRDPSTGRSARVYPAGKSPVDYDDRELFVNGVVRKDIQAAMQAVESAVEGGHHEAILHEKFGDPAEVTVVREGDSYKFDVEHYDHD